MILTSNEVNYILDRCSYGGAYEEAFSHRLTHNQPKRLRLSLYDKDLLSALFESLDDEDLTEEEFSIKHKLFDDSGNYR